MTEDIINVLYKGGFVLIPIFLVAQVGWFFVIERMWFFHRLAFSQRRFWQQAPRAGEELSAFLRSGNAPVKGLFGSLVKDISKNIKLGEKAMVNAVKSSLHDNITGMQKHMGTIAVMAASAPLLGLLGTVSGMVATFNIITQYGTGNPAMMAEGISEALLTTQAGLIVSFPLVLMHNYLLNRADAIESECISGATKLINGLR
jgi:biopolymer transport protein ExbB